MVTDLQKGALAQRSRKAADASAEKTAKIIAITPESNKPPESNKLGQQRGAKGTRTRRAIMDATIDLLRGAPLGDVKIADIARAANIAQPNFYTYFSSIEEVVYSLAEEIDADEIAEAAETNWEGPDGLEQVRKLVEAALPLWRRHHSVLRVMFILADGGSKQFADLQWRLMGRIFEGIEARVREAQKAGRISDTVKGRLVGFECVNMLSALSNRYTNLRNSGFSHEDMIDTTARLIFAGVTGRPTV